MRPGFGKRTRRKKKPLEYGSKVSTEWGSFKGEVEKKRLTEFVPEGGNLEKTKKKREREKESHRQGKRGALLVHLLRGEKKRGKKMGGK